MVNGLCFVISQIGEDGSDERRQADALLDLVEICCELQSLQCVRADMIVGTNDINEDIVEHVRNAELCIIDLTNLNPNVMYEFGMRFQTGRPYIILARKDTKLPFDTAMYRTIFYDDLTLAAESKRVQKIIRNYIGVFESKDFSSLATTPSLTNIYALLEKIDSKLDNINVSQVTSSSLSNSAPVDMTGIDDLLNNLDPVQAFHYAYKTNQIFVAEELLKLLKGQHPFDYYFNKLCALCNIGSVYAVTELENSIEEIIASNNKENIIEAIGCMVSNYNRRDVENEKIEFMETVFDSAISKMTTNKERASILNQKQRLLAGAQRYEEAKGIIESILSLNDEEPAYYFNYTTILEKLGYVEEAIVQVRNMIALDTEDDDHIFLACRLLKTSKDDDDKTLYQKCMKKLEEMNPYKARLIRFR